MDAPEPGQGPDRPSDAAESRAARPDEEDLLAAMQATRGEPTAGATPDTSASEAAAAVRGTETAVGEAAAAKPSRGSAGRRRMVAVVGALAALAIAAVALFAVRGFFSPAATVTLSPTSSVVASGTPRSSAGTATPATSANGGSASVIVPASVGPSASESLPAQTAPSAQVTFNELVLYPSLTAAKQAATFTFVSDGPGRVSASIVASAPKDASRICLSGDGGTPICASGATPTASFYSQSIQSKWTVTVGSANEESPTVDVQLTWPSNKASITVSNVPFQGHPNRDSLRSLTATFASNGAGAVALAASWPPSSLTTSFTVWLVDQSGQHVVDQKSYPAAGSLPAGTGFTAKAGVTYRVTLANESEVTTPNPSLTATLQLP